MKKQSLIVACIGLSVFGSSAMAQSGAGVKQSQFSTVTNSVVNRTREGNELISVDTVKTSSMSGDQKAVQIGFSISGTEGIMIDSGALMDSAMQIMSNQLAETDALPMEAFDGMDMDVVLGTNTLQQMPGNANSLSGQFNGTETEMTFTSETAEVRKTIVDDGYISSEFVESFNTETGTYNGI